MNLTIVGLRKFWTRIATIVSILVAIGIIALEFVGIGISYSAETSGGTSGGPDAATFAWYLTYPGTYDAALSLVYAFLGIIGLIWIATAAGTEWSWGTLKVAVARGNSRSGYVLSTFASLSIILLVGVLIAFVVALLAAFAGAQIAGLSPGSPLDGGALPGVLVKFFRLWIALTALMSLAYAITMVAKSQMAGIGAVIGYFAISIIGPALMPEIVKQVFRYLPFSISSDAIGLANPPGTGMNSVAIEPNLALVITIGWLVGLLAVACVSVERAEITG